MHGIIKNRFCKNCLCFLKYKALGKLATKQRLSADLDFYKLQAFLINRTKKGVKLDDKEIQFRMECA
jgi:hypothetical protein